MRVISSKNNNIPVLSDGLCRKKLLGHNGSTLKPNSCENVDDATTSNRRIEAEMPKMPNGLSIIIFCPENNFLTKNGARYGRIWTRSAQINSKFQNFKVSDFFFRFAPCLLCTP